MRQFLFDQIIVIGGTGQTGHRVIDEVLSYGVRPKVVATSRAVTATLARQWADHVIWKPLDLAASPSVLDEQLEEMRKCLGERPTVLVFAAAFTNVEGCETDPEKCRLINEVGTVRVLDWARRNFEAKLVFYSTDYVFDGKEGPYGERATRNAISVYGASKAKVEEWLGTHASSSLILRTTGVFDHVPGSKNFLMQMIELWGRSQKTKVPRDQYSNPVWAKDLATATLRLLDHKASGIYNVAGGMQMARTDWARAIAKHFHLKEELIESVATADLNQKARRPLRGGLKLDKLQEEINWIPLAAPEALKKL